MLNAASIYFVFENTGQYDCTLIRMAIKPAGIIKNNISEQQNP